jgi:hypothetical protein
MPNRVVTLSVHTKQVIRSPHRVNSGCPGAKPSFHLQLIRAKNSAKCEPSRFQLQAVTRNRINIFVEECSA